MLKACYRCAGTPDLAEWVTFLVSLTEVTNETNRLYCEGIPRRYAKAKKHGNGFKYAEVRKGHCVYQIISK